MSFKYLHVVSEGVYWLDHRLVPEVRGMLAAQSSRAPVGGVRARYGQVVEAVAIDLFEKGNPYPENTWGSADRDFFRSKGVGCAEDRLCEYPLHPKVQKFFDDFVGKYGHSSILELVGSPTVFSEGVSWFTSWLLFDSPLCAGQEFSTRAVQHKDWPMARECYHKQYITGMFVGQPPQEGQKYGAPYAGSLPPLPDVSNPDIATLHADWFAVFEAEVAWWKDHLSVEVNRAALGIGDKEPFRPALDRARWALPGTIATGCAHATNLRERSRVLRDGSVLAQMSKCPSAESVWKDIARAYKEALPGMAGMGLREAVYGDDSPIPGHLRDVFSDAPDGPDAEVELVCTDGLHDVAPFTRKGEKSYADPLANTLFRVNVTLRCSLAVARDWHRHRTMYPWHLQIVRTDGPDIARVLPSPGTIQIDHHYTPMSDVAKALVPELLRRSTAVFDACMERGNVVQAALALPLGTRVRMRGQGGLRDAVYMLELRKYASGANFEYVDQAGQALRALRERRALPLQDWTRVTTLLGPIR